MSKIAVPKIYTTDFEGKENPLSEGGRWQQNGLYWKKVRKVNGLAYGTQTGSGGFDDSYAYLSGFPPDHSGSGAVHVTPGHPGNHEVEILLRWSDDAQNAWGYECLLPYHDKYTPQIVRWNGPFGDFTYLAKAKSPVIPKTGDVFSASIKGNLIIVCLNGVEVVRATDDTYKTGNPGIGFFIRGKGSNSAMALTSFTAKG